MSFLNQLASGAAAVADKVDDKPAAPAAAAAAPAAAAPAAAAPADPAAAAAPAAAAPAAPAAAAPPAEAPVDIKATLLGAVDDFKKGDYMGAAQDVMKTGLVQKLAASQGGKTGEAGAAGGSGDMMSNLMSQAGGLLGGAGKTGADASNPLGSIMGSLGGAGGAAKPPQ